MSHTDTNQIRIRQEPFAEMKRKRTKRAPLICRKQTSVSKQSKKDRGLAWENDVGYPDRCFEPLL